MCKVDNLHMGQMDERQMSKVEFDTMFSSLGLEAAEI